MKRSGSWVRLPSSCRGFSGILCYFLRGLVNCGFDFLMFHPWALVGMAWFAQLSRGSHLFVFLSYAESHKCHSGYNLPWPASIFSRCVQDSLNQNISLPWWVLLLWCRAMQHTKKWNLTWPSQSFIFAMQAYGIDFKLPSPLLPGA